MTTKAQSISLTQKTINLVRRANEIARLNFQRTITVVGDLGVPLHNPFYVVYNDTYVTDFDGGLRHTIDGRRPLRIVERLRREGVIRRSQLLRAPRVSDADLQLVHPPEFLRTIRQPDRIAELFHCEANQLSLTESPLDPFLYQAGGTLLALRQAIRKRVPVINLGGGFHHAQRDRAEGFCPFNDVAVAIERVRRENAARRVLVIDLDYHHGNGTAQIFSKNEEVFTLSIHGKNWAQIEGKRNTCDIQLPPGTDDATYLDAVKEAVVRVLQRFRPDATIYIAGADPFVLDKLGDFHISEDGMLARDLFVWQQLSDADIPFAVVLGGGYGPNAWMIPYNFIFSVAVGLPILPRWRPSNIAAEYRRIKQTLGPAELRRGEAEPLDATTLHRHMQRRSSSPLFLGTYTAQGIGIACARYGVIDMLRERGFVDLLLTLDTDDPTRQTMRVHFDQKDADHLLIELIVRFRDLAALPHFPSAPRARNLLSIEWLCLQNPTAQFSDNLPRLPGQRFPGLGMGHHYAELLRMMAERLEGSGLMSTPDHYHNALIYAEHARFFDPVIEGRFLALRDLFGTRPLVEAASLIEHKSVVDLQTNEPFSWSGHPQVLPLSHELTDYFDSDAYSAAVTQAHETAKKYLRLKSSDKS